MASIEPTLVESSLRFQSESPPRDSSASSTSSSSPTSSYSPSQSHSEFSDNEEGSDDSTSDNEDGDESNVNDEPVVEQKVRDVNRLFVSRKPLSYLGVAEDSSFIIQEIADCIPAPKKPCSLLSRDIVTIVFQKLRLNDSFDRLGDQYWVSRQHIGRIFSKFMPVIAKYLEPFVFWPTNEQIRKRLPIQFRHRYSSVHCMIDAFEIQIEKSTDPVLQALTWSDYKEANTFKYLLACSPDGLIVYLSIGFGGRTSDLELTRSSGFIDSLKEGMEVMADRGFKHVDQLLREKGCKLIRPPSVSAGEILSKEVSIDSKRIASLRSHVERAIRRIREFTFLAPHACTDHGLIKHLDNAVKIAGALVNLQPPIIAQ